ncbi:hypothetical protein PVMG_05514 [Plasmodium vivax Mauritania I]|uniref:PIR Superfamily Protein n=1 Tax=Plasmodium vivax Mauritania I TaxID=1035515 RepID=A0A0J9W3P4_PLAVI|nr:hypothetical protein PVMG_05514 [Plasmodium vivax Mauritania I]
MCGTEVFKTYHSVWDTRINEYLDYINNIKEPILKYISIYYVQYYIDGYDYYHKSENSQRSAACTYIKRWLRKQKDIFTYGEKCEARKQLWENNFSTLWNKLQSKYVVPEHKNKTKPWCDNHPLTFKTEFSEEVTLPPYCDESIPQETISTNCPLLPVKEECDCSQSVVHEILSPPDQAPAADRTKNLAVTSGFTAAGTLGTLFFLYRVINKQ